MSSVDLVRPGWRDSLRAGTDLAIVGFGVLLACLPVLTAGAAIGAGSAAVHHWCEHHELPPARQVLRWFVHGLLPGLGAVASCAAVVALLVWDVRSIAAGHAPGGPLLLILTLLATAYAIGIAGLTIVHVGRRDGRHWCAGLRLAVMVALKGPGRTAVALPAMTVVTLIAALLVSVLPPTAPLVVAFTLFAAHVTARRLGI